MLNPLNLISKIFKSSNQKELDKLTKLVTNINKFESQFSNINDNEFSKKPLNLSRNLKKGHH